MRRSKFVDQWRLYAEFSDLAHSRGFDAFCVGDPLTEGDLVQFRDELSSYTQGWLLAQSINSTPIDRSQCTTRKVCA